MANFRIKKVVLQDFKGFHEKEYDESEIERMKQPNGTGKTTVATAITWTLFDKDYELNSNPNIRPNNEEENEFVPSVTLLLDIDGTEITFMKSQKKLLSKPNEAGVRKVTLTNSYEINSVPKREADIEPFFKEHGIDYKLLLPCVHPDVFVGQKAIEMRNILFSMAKNHSDAEIASGNDETKELAVLLDKYKLDEVKAMNEASLKKAKEKCDSIPDEIIGMESSKVDIDVAELELQKSSLEQQIAEKKSNVDTGSQKRSELSNKLFKLEFDRNGLYQKEYDALVLERRQHEHKLADVQVKLNERVRGLQIIESDLANITHDIEQITKQKDDLLSQWKETNLKQFDESLYVFDEKSNYCPSCGREYVAEKLETIKAEFEARKKMAKDNFESDKQSILKKITIDGKNKCAEIEQLKQRLEINQGRKYGIEDEIKSLNTEIESETATIATISSEPNMVKNVEYQNILKEITDAKKQLEEIPDSIVLDTDALEYELTKVTMLIGSYMNNARIDENIAQKREDMREYEQSKANAMRILDQIKALSRIKNDLLSDEINGHFSKVTWKLWELQKNGEYKDVCIPLIDGYEFGRSTNTGREILAKIDICDSLQRFNGYRLPIIVDKAESLNESNYPVVDTQLIMLSVGE